MKHAATFNSHYMSSLITSISRVTSFYVSVAGCLKFPREVMWL
ncbi:MAG: hypothetical protein PV344_05755 [Anaplasma sp.]|nr:hypothetical protein [Anaplasma sp.]